MPELDFKEWVAKKVDEARSSEQAQRQAEWLRAYEALKDQIHRWLDEDGGGQIPMFSEWVQHRERGLGTYDIEGLRIELGDSRVDIVPVGRNVIAHINPPGGGEFRGAGRVDIRSGVRKHILYRTIQDGKDVWYAFDDDRYQATLFTRERLHEILMDLLS